MQGKNSVHFSSKNSEWETPNDLFDKLNAEFKFAMDVCANEENTKCDMYMDKSFNALGETSWDYVYSGIIGGKHKNDPPAFWLNPPYGRKVIDKWVDRAYKESSACTIVCLLPARTDTRWWSIFWDRKEHCPKPGIRVRFLEGRLKFVNAQNSAPFPSAIVIMERWKI